MKIIYRRCAGLDVHEKSVFVCARIMNGKSVEVVEATFPTFTEDLEELKAWLIRHRIQRVAMESTGVYWRPVWNILEQGGKLDLLLLNPQHVKALPGHRTDRVDAARIAELLQYGLVLASFVPPTAVRERRDLLRHRVHVQQDRNRVSNRIHRLLETANVRLSSVLRKVPTKTFRSILEGLATAEYIHPEALAMLEQRIAARMESPAELIARLSEIPGVDRITAWTMIAEIGTDMSRFPSAAHLASWCGLCPGNRASAGKRHSGHTGKGNRYIRRVLVQAAWAAARIRRRRTFFTTLFYRISSRAGMKKAAVAVAHRILTLAYCMIRDGSSYREQGADYFDRLHPERTRNRLIQRLDRLSFAVTITPKLSAKTG